MGIGLNSDGHSLNSKIISCRKLSTLYTLTPNIKVIVVMRMKGYIIQNNAAIGVTFSGEPAVLALMKTYAMSRLQKPATLLDIGHSKTVKNKKQPISLLTLC